MLIAILPLLLLVGFLVASVIFIKTGNAWMLGIILSVVGSVGVIVATAHIVSGNYALFPPVTSGAEHLHATLVCSTLSLFTGLIMTIHGLRKK
jgi:hypothetical protein